MSVSANRMHISRKELIQAITAKGYELVVVGPDSEKECKNNLFSLGVGYIGIPINRTSMNPVSELKVLNALYKLLIRERPDVVLTYGVKLGLYGSFAARLAGIKNIFSVFNGTGYFFNMKGAKGDFIRSLLLPWFRISLSACKVVFFQNPDDCNLFLELKLVKKDNTLVVNGSGVNLERFSFTPLPDKPVFLMICRIIMDKGVFEYLEAARKVKKIYPQTRFVLLGPFDANPNSLTYEQIESYITDGIAEYIPEQKDIRPYIANCSVYVLPSYYREGTPRTVLEAMATGRPIITTDSPGCRETVVDGSNGFLIPVKNADALAEKMIWMIQHPEETKEMAKKSREICEQKYDVNKVNKIMMRSMSL